MIEKQEITGRFDDLLFHMKWAQRFSLIRGLAAGVIIGLMLALVFSLTGCERITTHIVEEIIDPDDEEPCTLPPGLCGQEEDLVEEATKAEYRRKGVPHRDSSWVSRPTTD